MKKILFIVNVDWFFLSHRKAIADELVERGYEVHVAFSKTLPDESFADLGFVIHEFNCDRKSTSLAVNIKIFLQIFSLIRLIRPNLVHLVTIKPVIFGGLAAKLLRVEAIVSAIPGLGSSFVDKGRYSAVKKKIILSLYKLASRSTKFITIFQNEDDRDYFLSKKILKAYQCKIIAGSGVNLKVFSFSEPSISSPSFLMACRLIREKGVFEFERAAQEIKQQTNQNIEFALAGGIDEGNPKSLTRYDLSQIKKRGQLNLLGQISDMCSLIPLYSVVVLPSYYGEGLPKILIEAAACGRAVITTNTAGCKDTVVDTQTGILVEVQNHKSLVKAIGTFISDTSQIQRMGKNARAFAEEKFDLNLVIHNHLKVYNDLLE